MEEKEPNVGEGCEIKQKGAIDVQIKKNSRQWTEVQITYRVSGTFVF